MGRIGSRWEGIVSSFWFTPDLLTAVAVVLFVATHQIDRIVSADLEELPLIFSGGATAARSLLSTIAGSLITVVATVFSLTIVALQLASTSYTPRLLRNFTSDRGVQVVLGVYIGTFTYALLVLRTIRTPESQNPAFIPVISVSLAVLLTLVCVGLLVYFIHHIAGMIQSSTIVKSAHQDATWSLADLTDLENAPAEVLQPREHPDFSGLLDGESTTIKAQQSGYVQYIDLDRILESLVQENSAPGAWAQDEQQGAQGYAGSPAPESGPPVPTAQHPVAQAPDEQAAQREGAEVQARDGVAQALLLPEEGHDRAEYGLREGEVAHQPVGRPGDRVADEAALNTLVSLRFLAHLPPIDRTGASIAGAPKGVQADRASTASYAYEMVHEGL